MTKKILASAVFILIPLLFGYSGVVAGFPEAAAMVRQLIQGLPGNSALHAQVLAVIGPLGLFLAMFGTVLLSRSTDLKDNRDGTVTLGGMQKVGVSDLKIRTVLPGLAVIDFYGVKLFSLAPDVPASVRMEENTWEN